MFAYAALRRIVVAFLVFTAPVLAATVTVNGSSSVFDNCSCVCEAPTPTPRPAPPLPSPNAVSPRPAPPSPIAYYTDPFWDSPSPAPKPAGCPYAAGSITRCPGGDIFASDGSSVYHLSPEGYAALGLRMYKDGDCADFYKCGSGPTITKENYGILKKFYGVARRLLRSRST